MLTEFPGTARGWGCRLRAGCSALQAALTHRCDAQSPHVLRAQAPFKFLSMEVELATRRSQTLLWLIFKSSVRRTGSKGQGFVWGMLFSPHVGRSEDNVQCPFPGETKHTMVSSKPITKPPATHCSSWSILRDLWGLDWPGSAPDPLSQWGRESQSRTGAGFWKASQGWLRIIIATWQQQREIQHVRSHPQTSRLQDLSMRDSGKGLKSARSFLITLRGQRT